MRSILPLILVAASVGLFVVYINPTYQGTKEVSLQMSAYDQALTTSKQLKSQRDQLLSRRDTFSQTDVQKLQEMLPDNVDNIRLIIDINNIAARHQLVLNNVALGTVSSASNARSSVAIGASGDPVGSVELGFSVSASYGDFMAFLMDLEHSLRVIDIEKLSFKSGTNLTEYTFTIRTYWLH